MTNEVKDFLNNYLKEPLENCAKEEIMDALQEYLIDRGYGKEKTIATIEFVTNGGRGVDFSNFLDVEEDSEFAKKLSNLDVAKIYSYYAAITTFAPDIYSLYDNLNGIEECRNENGTYNNEGKERLEDALYDFLSISANLIDVVPGGFIYSTIFNELPNYISHSIDLGKKHNQQIYATSFILDNNLDGTSFDKWYEGDWQNGPTLIELERIYNNNNINTDKEENGSFKCENNRNKMRKSGSDFIRSWRWGLRRNRGKHNMNRM